MTITRDIEAKLEQVLEKNEALARENKILREELAALKRGLFGRRSERLDPGQLGFFETDEAAAKVERPEPAAPKPKKKPGHGRAPFPAHLPREVIELKISDPERQCDCGKSMQRIGEEVTERGHIIPARIVVKRYVREKYACPDGHGVKTASLPDGVIDGGKYEASVYAHIATAKYSDHLPLHRLQGIFKRYGEPIAKQSMWDMLVVTARVIKSTCSSAKQVHPRAPMTGS